MKQKTAIISLIIVGVLLITTIILAIVPVNHAIKVENPNQIILHYNGDYKILTESENSNEYCTIISKLKKSGKEKVIEAMFNGRLGEKVELNVDATSKKIDYTSGCYLEYYYATGNLQTLKDGKSNYKYSSGEVYRYARIIFELNSEDDFITCNAYVIPVDTATDYEDSVHYTKYYTFTANLSSLNEYVVGLMK